MQGEKWYNKGMKSHKETDYRKARPETVYELKKVALRLRRKGKRVKEICETTGLSDKTVRMTFAAYDEGGINAIKPKVRGRRTGEKRHLTQAQEQEILKLLVDHSPEQFKIKGCLWTRDSVREFIHQKYGIDMPIRTIREYLHRWGLTVQRPAKQAMNQKPEQVGAWLNEQYPAIHAEAKSENAEIFWGDETAVQNVANYVRGYAPKGQTPVVKIQTKKMHIDMISAINNHGKLHFLLYSDAIDSDRLISFVQTIVQTADGRKVYLILDNLRVHHSKKVSEWVEEHKHQIRLFHLPPYSPEYNPDEYLNNDLKRNLGTQAMVKDVQELEANTSEFMNRLSDDPDHVKAYFDHPTLAPYSFD